MMQALLLPMSTSSSRNLRDTFEDELSEESKAFPTTSLDRMQGKQTSFLFIFRDLYQYPVLDVKMRTEATYPATLTSMG